MVLVTHYLGTAEENPVYTPDQRWGVIGGFLEQVARYNNHPAILMWSFGNELNGPWNLFTTQLSWVNGCGWTGGCMNSRDPNSPCMWQVLYISIPIHIATLTIFSCSMDPIVNVMIAHDCQAACLYTALFNFINDACRVCILFVYHGRLN
jgi:hypothetical protein